MCLLTMPLRGASMPRVSGIIFFRKTVVPGVPPQHGTPYGPTTIERH